MTAHLVVAHPSRRSHLPHLAARALAVLGSLAACDAAPGAGGDAGPPLAGEPDAAPAEVGPDARPAIPFVVGLSQVSGGIEPIVDELGVGWVRQTIGWDALEPTVALTDRLTLAEARTDAALVAFVEGHDFAEVDAAVTRFTDRGVHVVVGVGSGWNRSLPTVADGRPAGPDVIGRRTYLARQTLVTRAVVERFDGDGWLDAPGSPRAAGWQVENELNEAFATAIGYARYPGGVDAIGSAWADVDFVDRVFRTLVAAVRGQAADAVVMANFHASVHPGVDARLAVPTWQEMVVRWRDALDWIGLDAYPNYIEATPLGSERIGGIVAEAVTLAESRPVVVIETGYGSGPAVLGYDEDRQARMLEGSYAAVRAAGGSGLFWFGTRSSESHSVEISARDVATLDRLATAYGAGDIDTVLGLIAEDRPYFEDHLMKVVDASGGYLGLVRADGSHKPAWDRLAEVLAAP